MKFEWLDLDYKPTTQMERVARFGFECPRHPGRMCSGLLLRGRDGGTVRPSWEWNGSIVAPTFTPSINCLTQDGDGKPLAGCGWHGHITAGVADPAR